MDEELKGLILSITNADEFSTSFLCAWLDDTIMVLGKFQEPLIEIRVIEEVVNVTRTILINNDTALIDIQ